LTYRVSPLWPTYLSERRTTFDKAYTYGIKVWRTCWGTYWELERKVVKTHQEPGKNEKNPYSPLPKLKRKKKKGTLNACLGLPIGCMKFLFTKEFLTIFGLG
jgi:hypothetical protein